MRFLRQYLAFAKKISPALTLAAAQYLAERYTELRSKDLNELAEQEQLARVRSSILKLHIYCIMHALNEYLICSSNTFFHCVQLVYLNSKDSTCNCAHSRNVHPSGHFPRSGSSLYYCHEARCRSRQRSDRIRSLQGGSLK